jgi:hypothetical protein
MSDPAFTPIGPDIPSDEGQQWHAADMVYRSRPGIVWGWLMHPDTEVAKTPPTTLLDRIRQAGAFPGFFGTPVWFDETMPVGVFRPVRVVPRAGVEPTTTVP